jgi:hypothetical protein
MITVRYDAQIFAIQRVGGISRYFAELAGTFGQEKSLGIRPTLSSRLLTNPTWRASGSPAHTVAKLLMRAPGQPERADLVHHTYYSPQGLRRHGGTPCVSTIHDMIPELMPEYFPHGKPQLAKAQYEASCDGLIFV